MPYSSVKDAFLNLLRLDDSVEKIKESLNVAGLTSADIEKHVHAGPLAMEYFRDTFVGSNNFTSFISLAVINSVKTPASGIKPMPADFNRFLALSPWANRSLKRKVNASAASKASQERGKMIYDNVISTISAHLKSKPNRHDLWETLRNFHRTHPECSRWKCDLYTPDHNIKATESLQPFLSSLSEFLFDDEHIPIYWKRIGLQKWEAVDPWTSFGNALHARLWSAEERSIKARIFSISRRVREAKIVFIGMWFYIIPYHVRNSMPLHSRDAETRGHRSGWW